MLLEKISICFFTLLIFTFSFISNSFANQFPTGTYKSVDSKPTSNLEISKNGEAYKVEMGVGEENLYMFQAFSVDKSIDNLKQDSILGLVKSAVKGKDAFILLNSLPSGVHAVFIDKDTQKIVQKIFFVEEGFDLFKTPKNWLAEPDDEKVYMSSLSFLDSYPFWTGDAVSYSYNLLSVNHRAIIRTFSYVQTDIAWKICQAEQTSAALFEVLESQGTDCKTILQKVSTLQKQRTWEKFKEKVMVEKSLLIDTLSCTQGMFDEQSCEAIMKNYAIKAENPKTIKQILM